MSTREVDRFQKALAENPGILSEFPAGGDVASLARLGKSLGYDFTEDELREKLERSLRAVNDTELDQVAAAGTLSSTPGLVGKQKDFTYTQSNVIIVSNLGGVTEVAVATEVAAVVFVI